MTVFSLEMQSQVAQLSASRDAEQDAENAKRLAEWRGRCFRDPVFVPAPVSPPEWPARRISIDPPSKVTRLKVRA